MYNKNTYKKINDKKVLHKVKKQWVTISLALLMMIGGGAVATHVSANADATNNARPVATAKAPIRHVVKPTSVSSASSASQQSLNQSSIETRYHSDGNELDSIVNGSYGKVTWTPSMMNAYDAIVSASSDDNKETSAFNTNSTASNASNYATFSNASMTASNDDVTVNNEISAFASNYPTVASHIEHGSLLQSYMNDSVSARMNMIGLDTFSTLTRSNLEPFNSLSNAYQSDSNLVSTNLSSATHVYQDFNYLTNDALKSYINNFDTVLSNQSNMTSISNEASMEFYKLPVSQQDSFMAKFYGSNKASANTSASATKSANTSISNAMSSESASATHLTNAQLQFNAQSAIDSYSIREYGTPNVLASEIRNDAIAYKDTAYNLSSESASSKIASAYNEASTSSAINSYLATLNSSAKTSAENVINAVNSISNANSIASSSSAQSFSNSVNSVISSVKNENDKYYNNYRDLDSSYAISAYGKSTGNHEMMTSALQSAIVSDYNTSLLANNAVNDNYEANDTWTIRNYLLSSGANLYYNSVKSSTMAKYPAVFVPNTSSSATSSKASSSVAPSSTSSNASSEASSSANSSVSSQSSNQSSATSQNSTNSSNVAPSSEQQSSDNNADNTPFVPSFNVPTTPTVTPTQNTTTPTNNNSSSVVTPLVEPQVTNNNESINSSTTPTVNKHHNNHVAHNRSAKRASLYLSNTSFKGLSKRNRSVVTTKGVRAYKRTRKGRYVSVMNIKPNTKLAVKQAVKYGKSTKLQLANGLFITSDTRFVKIPSNKRVAKRSYYRYLSNYDFKGLYKRNRSVVALKGVWTYRRNRKGKLVRAVYVKRGTRLAVNNIIRLGKGVDLRLKNGRFVTADKRFVSVKNIAKRTTKRTAKRAIKGIDASRYDRALRKSNYVLRHGRRHATRYIYRTAKKFNKANNAEEKAYRKFARKHTNRNRKAVNKAITKLGNLVNALLK